MRDDMHTRVAAPAAMLGGALFAVTGALQATGLNWKENAVESPLQHLTMALFAAGLVVVTPAAAMLADYAGSRMRFGWLGLVVGPVAVAAASTVSNIRGVDASWFPAVAVAANVLWILGTFTLATGLWRARRVPRLLAIGLIVAYVGEIPFATQGGGLVAGGYWLAVGYLASLGTLERRTLRPATV